MPKRKDLKKIMIIGSGPITIGQACEFDYSGTQACKALMAEGYQVVLVNSNPATIMTDPEIAYRTYIEPLQPAFLEKIIEIEKPDALIVTLGGQTALNLGLSMSERGILESHGVELIGATPEVIRAAEDRDRFCRILDSVGAQYSKNILVKSFEQGIQESQNLNLPLILRPNYTLGGGGGGVAYSYEEFHKLLAVALQESPTHEVMVEESLLGWKEFELEVMRDSRGTFVVVCSIENLDPCGVHTGDSVTVAPQQTLSDREYQAMRMEARAIVNAVGLQTGGANIQFAVHPTSGARVVIEMNPRVSRSSALASKATGFPIAKIAALLAVGYTLEEVPNFITQTTPSCYEPALDYVVTKIPRFAFEKFPGAKDVLSTQMKSVGEVMAMGRTFQESFQKALLSLEENDFGLPEVTYHESELSYPNSHWVLNVAQAFREGISVDDVFHRTRVSPWFLEQIKGLVDFESEITNERKMDGVWLLKAKQLGFSDARIAQLRGQRVESVRKYRWEHQISPHYYQVDTCAGEFRSSTPYYYSSYWGDQNVDMAAQASSHPAGQLIVVLGSGPNRIGQGIEFDYSCVRAVQKLRQLGHRVAMVNSNPETVSTDYDISDELFFEPMTLESIVEVMRFLNPMGFIAQLGGQTPLNLAQPLAAHGFKMLGTSAESIDSAEDRGRFAEICQKLKLKIPKSAVASSVEHARRQSHGIGYPVICRPSYVLGGRRMEVIESDEELIDYFTRNRSFIDKIRPCFMDEFLEGALEVDVDLVRGVDWTIVGGILEHIEAAGVHSGDSMAVLPPQRLRDETCARIQAMSIQLGNELNIIGHLNLQLAIKDEQIYVLEANPRSSRSVPFIAKATGIPISDLGVLAMLEKNSKEVQPDKYNWKNFRGVFVKGVVFPFKKFPEADVILGPEMKSTGEGMGWGATYAEALLKACLTSQARLPKLPSSSSWPGEVFFSLRDKDKPVLLDMARELIQMGYRLSATRGTAEYFEDQGLKCESVRKVHEGRPHCVDRIRSGQVAAVVNTTRGRLSVEASFGIRRSCIDYAIPCLTESDAAHAFLIALRKHQTGEFQVAPFPLG